MAVYNKNGVIIDTDKIYGGYNSYDEFAKAVEYMTADTVKPTVTQNGVTFNPNLAYGGYNDYNGMLTAQNKAMGTGTPSTSPAYNTVYSQRQPAPSLAPTMAGDSKLGDRTTGLYDTSRTQLGSMPASSLRSYATPSYANAGKVSNIGNDNYSNPYVTIKPPTSGASLAPTINNSRLGTGGVTGTGTGTTPFINQLKQYGSGGTFGRRGY